MDARELTPQILADLRAPRPYPAVTLTMPTRQPPETEHDALRLRTLHAAAIERVTADPEVSPKARQAVLGQLEAAMAEVDLRHHAQDALLVFADADGHQVWYGPHEVPERVALDTTFLTRNLVAAHEYAHPFWVLAVDAEHATLWDGTHDTLMEASIQGFPLAAPAAPAPDPQREERQGDTPSIFREERVRTLMRDAGTALGAVLAEDPRPYFLVGQDAALGALADAGTQPGAPAGSLTVGGRTRGPAHTLLTALRPVLDAHLATHRQKVAERIEQAAGGRVLAAGLDEVKATVEEARAGLLVVEENYHPAVRTTGGHLAPVAASTAGADGTVHEDIVDEIIEQALAHGSEVVFVPDNWLAEHGRIAAALRY